MNLNELQLPGFVIANLYKNHLVEPDETQKLIVQEIIHKPESVENKSTLNIEFLGNHNKQITIVLKDDENVYLKDDDLKFITNILKACHLTIADVAIVNINSQKIFYKDFQENLIFKHFILFGISTFDLQLPFTIPNYQNQKYNQQQFLVAPSLHILNSETQEARIEKTKLWNALKNMFDIK